MDRDLFVPGGAVAPVLPLQLDRPVTMVRVPGVGTADGTWRAELSLPLERLGLNGAKIASISIGMPWRSEPKFGEPLPFKLEGGRLNVTVPDAVPSVETWGAKVNPTFVIKTADGRSNLLTVHPRQLTRDTTLLTRQSLESSIAATETVKQSLHDSATRLRSFLADPTRIELAPTTSRVDGTPYLQYVAGLRASSQQELRAITPRLEAAQAAVSQRLDGATVHQQSLVLQLALGHRGPGENDALSRSLGEANNAFVKAREDVKTQTLFLDETRAFLPPGELADSEAELSRATAARTAAEAKFGGLLDQARSVAPREEVLATADVALGADLGIQDLQARAAMVHDSVARWQVEFDTHLAAALLDAQHELPKLADAIAEEQARGDDYRTQLAQLAPETDTIDVR